MHVIDHADYMSLAESEFRTQYRKMKWTASKTDPSSVFFLGKADGANTNDDDGGKCEGRVRLSCR